MYKVGFGASGVGHFVDTWGFYGGGTTGRSVTPLLLEHTGGNNYTLRAIGQTRTVGSGGIVTGLNANLPFNTQTGSSFIANASYYLGWKDGTQTSANQGVINFDTSGPSNFPFQSLRYAALSGNSSQNITGANIGSALSFGNASLWARRYSLQATAGICPGGAGAGDLVSYWRANGNACDSADGNHGTLKNGAGFGPGQVGQAFSFDGANDYVQVPDADNLDLSDGSFTIKAWINPRSPRTGTFQWVVDKADDNTNLDYLFGLNSNGQLRIISRQNLANDLLGPVIPTDVFTHVAAVQDVAGGQVRLYVNGVEVGSATLTGTPVANTSNLIIGARQTGPSTTTNQFFKGQIDEIRLYNTAHTAAEIKAQYDKENGGLVSLWPAEGDADDLIDGNDGTLTNGATFAAGKFGRAFSFDGVNDYVTVPDDPNLRLGKSQTVEAWYKWAGGGAIDWRRLVGKGNNIPRNYGLWIRPQTNQVLFQIYSQNLLAGSCSALYIVTSDTDWHHLAGTYDGSRIKLYYDGGLVSDQPCTLTPAISADPLTIGFQSGNGPHSPFDGLIDEVHVFNRALSACEVKVNALVACAVPDTTDPVVTVPADITEEATGPSGATVSFSASADDIVDGAITPTCVPASGSIFPLGTTEVTCSATDVANNTGEESFDVTVEDTTPPDVTVPADITEEATSPSGATVSFSASADDIVDGAITPTCVPASGSIFPLGTTEVTCSATDQAGNTGQASFDVTVQDTTAPVLSLPADITVDATGPSGAAVSYSASANDIVDGSVTPVCTPASRSTFPIGTTSVSCTATDAASNQSNASFNVTVLGPKEMKAGAKSSLEGLTGSDKHSQKELDKAIEDLDKSLADKLWVAGDPSRLVEKTGKKVFDEEKKAVKHLMKILKDKGKASDPAIADDVSDVIDRLVNAARVLAETALADAQEALAGLDPGDKKVKKVAKEIAKAEKELAKAQQELGKGKSDKAIDKYKKAWEHAQHAIKHANK